LNKLPAGPHRQGEDDCPLFLFFSFLKKFFFAKSRLNTSRAYHTATLLSSGNVLLAGGLNSGGALSSSEVYTPFTDSFALLPAFLSSARYGHTATLLPSGAVLLAGGASGATADLYDPTTGAFVATGPMAAVRRFHTATLLSDSLVLVVGGVGSGGTPIGSCELYNFVTNTWIATGSLIQPRSHHAMSSLRGSKLLVSGGRSGAAQNTGTISCEVYDHSTRLWSPTVALRRARESHSSVLLPNGLVLVSSGSGTAEAEVFSEFPISGDVGKLDIQFFAGFVCDESASLAIQSAILTDYCTVTTPQAGNLAGTPRSLRVISSTTVSAKSYGSLDCSSAAGATDVLPMNACIDTSTGTSIVVQNSTSYNVVYHNNTFCSSQVAVQPFIRSGSCFVVPYVPSYALSGTAVRVFANGSYSVFLSGCASPISSSSVFGFGSCTVFGSGSFVIQQSVVQLVPTTTVQATSVQASIVPTTTVQATTVPTTTVQVATTVPTTTVPTTTVPTTTVPATTTTVRATTVRATTTVQSTTVPTTTVQATTVPTTAVPVTTTVRATTTTQPGTGVGATTGTTTPGSGSGTSVVSANLTTSNATGSATTIMPFLFPSIQPNWRRVRILLSFSGATEDQKLVLDLVASVLGIPRTWILFFQRSRSSSVEFIIAPSSSSTQTSGDYALRLSTLLASDPLLFQKQPGGTIVSRVTAITAWETDMESLSSTDVTIIIVSTCVGGLALIFAAILIVYCALYKKRMSSLAEADRAQENDVELGEKSTPPNAFYGSSLVSSPRFTTQFDANEIPIVDESQE
jgi:hypothetical protein